MTDAQILSLVSKWQPKFGGPLLVSSSEEYPAARQIWNGMVDKRPALIARCTSPDDVKAAISLARTEGFRVSVRGGGHGVAGTAVCQDGLMIDLSPMKKVVVDPARREAIAEPGVLWGEFDRAAESHGLATTGGQVSHTGIAGLTLGGGLGYLMGKHGAVCDNLLSLDLVTAEGELVTANAEHNPDLFWAARGAGANFGVATSFRYRLHPLAGVFGGLIIHPRERAKEFIAFYREFLQGTPDELDTTLAFLQLPDGTSVVGAVVVYAGAADEGERVLAPLRAFGPPVADLVQAMPYTRIQSMLDAGVPAGSRYYWKSSFVDTLSPELAELLRDGANHAPSPLSMVLLFEVKGAIQRVPRDTMAFDHRNHNFEMSIIAQWKSAAEDAANIKWARDLWTAAQPYVSSAVYVNHMTADEARERVRAAYGPAKFTRLAQLKARYDPSNLFCNNHNIPPLAPNPHNSS
jgi:FAD/FMN-containing dehydrogenase